MGLRIFKLCRLFSMCSSYIRNVENDAILSTHISLPILYLTQMKIQINGIYKGFQGILC
jgi:hypothetical protein